MGKSGEGKMRTVRRAGRGRADSEKQADEQAEPASEDVVTLKHEAARLREELASARQRAERLEAANTNVAARLDVAIASIKSILERQG
jgi:predicted  nucleic acid-binding Zn-ribbon protein